MPRRSCTAPTSCAERARRVRPRPIRRAAVGRRRRRRDPRCGRDPRQPGGAVRARHGPPGRSAACPQACRSRPRVGQDVRVPRPRLLTSDDWPEAELRAAVLAGELVAVGPCWASPAEPQTPSLRAAAAAWVLRDARLIACTLTAAWIWGAVSRPPAALEACIPPQVRVHVGPDVRLREVRIDVDDAVELSRLRVTVPARTAVDLLRTPGPSAGVFGVAEGTAVHGLLAIGAVTAVELQVRLTALGTIPMARQAERRLRGLQDAAGGAGGAVR
ncbi:hypothetical protein DEJ17_01070 [Curtobacterium sp. MCSS17_011]|nr:hypothetical protein DEJ17_01070 [Curtobacterium sp. MCSS17_011]